MPEIEVKAAFLYHLAHFIEWPQALLTPSSKPFVICVAGESPVRRALDQLSRDKTVGPHPLHVRQVRANDDVHFCHILFIAASEGAKTEAYLDQVRGSPVLTVGEEPGFCSRGGVIEFLVDAERVRFDISIGGLGKSGLHASSRLLWLTRHSEEPVRAGGSR